MILSLLAIALVGLIAYLWSAQGAFSAFLHLVCVIVAGAVAFAVWEPLVYGVLLGVHKDVAWGVGLIAPFVLTLFLLRLATDRLLPKGLDFDAATNFAGGLIFGGLSGVLTVGILMIGVSFMRLPSSVLGHQPIALDSNGSLVRKGGALLPADRLTQRFYEALSAGAFSTPTPLASRMPDAHEQGAMARVTYGDKGLVAIRPEDFDVVGRYVVKGPGVSELLADSFTLSPDGGPVPQGAKSLDGSGYPQGSTLEGYIVRFKAGAKEKAGQIVVSPGHFRLVTRNEDGAAGALAPIAAVGRQEAHTFNLGRWRFDNSEPHYASVGGASDATFAIEFIVPPDAGSERDLYVRLVRVPIAGAPTEFGSVAARDEAVRGRAAPFDQIAQGALAEAPAQGAGATPVATGEPIRVSDRIGGTLNRSDRGGLEVDADNLIIDGEGSVSSKAMAAATGIDFKLRVERFASTLDTCIVQVDVSVPSRTTLFGRALDAALQAAPPVLVDQLGQQYEPVGFIHDTGAAVTIRFKPGEPIRAMSQLPTLSRSRPSEKLTLLFRVSAGVQIVRFALGNQTVEELKPPLATPPARTR